MLLVGVLVFVFYQYAGAVLQPAYERGDGRIPWSTEKQTYDTSPCSSSEAIRASAPQMAGRVTASRLT